MALTQGQTSTRIDAKSRRIGGQRHSEESSGERLAQQALEAAVWGMPIVSFEAMRRAFFAAGGNYGDFVYCSRPADWKFQITSPNASSLYVYFNFNTKSAPILLDVPPAEGAGLYGSINDAWQIPLADFGPEGEDKGKGGKYVILPPGYKDAVPFGVIAVRTDSYNGYGLLRIIPASSSEADRMKALALIKRLRLYPAAQWANPPRAKSIDIAGKLFDGIARMDDTFFDSLAMMVNEETAQTHDTHSLELLRSIGIEKGKPFKPNSALRATLRQATSEALAYFIDATTDVTPYWPESQWGTSSFLAPGVQSGFRYDSGGVLDIDARGAMFFFACAPPKRLGAASFYLAGPRDAAGAFLDGGTAYRLRVPPNVPARQFWAVTVYDLETASFLRGTPNVEVNSYQDIQRAADGSVDVFFGPNAPLGRHSNWIYTAPGRQWIAMFRFYGPQKALHDKTWRLPDIERIA